MRYLLQPKKKTPIISDHGVDLVLGGHDHIYYAGTGVTAWENFNVNEPILGAECDNGDVLVVKSGTDFRDLSEINLTLSSTPEGSLRSRVISRIMGIWFVHYTILNLTDLVSGKRHVVEPGSKSSEPMAKLLKTLLSSVSLALKAPLCQSTVMIDVRSSYIRTTEVGI